MISLLALANTCMLIDHIVHGELDPALLDRPTVLDGGPLERSACLSMPEQRVLALLKQDSKKRIVRARLSSDQPLKVKVTEFGQVDKLARLGRGYNATANGKLVRRLSLRHRLH